MFTHLIEKYFLNSCLVSDNALDVGDLDLTTMSKIWPKILALMELAQQVLGV